MYDLAILGGGPAGVAAGVYAARKKLKTIFITKDFGGQSVVSPDIQNWIGTISISGEELARNLKAHLLAYGKEILTVKEGNLVKNIEKTKDGFEITLDSKESCKSKILLVATGSSRRKLTVPGAKEFENKGITYCATCDGPLFADQDVAVIGGGNAAFETAAQLSAYCKSVKILQRSLDYRADPVTVEKVLAKPNVQGITGTEIMEIRGDKFVSSLVFKKTTTGEIIDLPITGIFVEVGLVPATSFVKDLVKLDPWGHIIVDPRNQRARLLPPLEMVSDARRGESEARGVVDATVSATQRLRNEADEAISNGVWAAGDCTDGLYHQNNIAAGDAIKALENIYMFLHAGKGN